MLLPLPIPPRMAFWKSSSWYKRSHSAPNQVTFLSLPEERFAYVNRSHVVLRCEEGRGDSKRGGSKLRW